MNPLTNMKNVKKLSEQELKTNFKTSWHDQYKNSAWIFAGGLPYDLTEGDIICVFSQYGEIVNINLVRDKGSGKSKGYCFLCFEDQRSTILTVDNLNGIKLLGRIIRVDHVEDYKAPKENKNMTEETRKLHEEGCAITNNAVIIKTEPVDDYENSGNLAKVDKSVKIKKETDIKKEKDVKDKAGIKKEKRDRELLTENRTVKKEKYEKSVVKKEKNGLEKKRKRRSHDDKIDKNRNGKKPSHKKSSHKKRRRYESSSSSSSDSSSSSSSSSSTESDSDSD